MQTARSTQDANRLTIIATLAGMLERLERSKVPVDPEQYRSVARRLADELKRARADDGLRAVFGASPAAAELYENLQYEHAGLCLRPVAAAASAELLARDAIAKARAA